MADSLAQAVDSLIAFQDAHRPDWCRTALVVNGPLNPDDGIWHIPDAKLSDVGIESITFASSMPRTDAGAYPAFLRVRMATPKICRAHGVTWRPDILCQRFDALAKNGRATFFSRMKNGVPVWCPQGRREVALDPSEPTQRWDPSFFASLALNARYCWRVGLQRPGGVQLQLPCSAGGALAAFKTRDLPKNSSRRAALLHWVDAHQRTRNATEHEVRAHLRGRTEFIWNGLACQLIPAPYDAERAQRPDLKETA